MEKQENLTSIVHISYTEGYIIALCNDSSMWRKISDFAHINSKYWECINNGDSSFNKPYREDTSPKLQEPGLNIPIESLFYIQNGFVGNAVSWWGIDGKGYTTDITKAGKYTEEWVLKQVNSRPQDVAWLCSHIDSNEQARKLIIDYQYLDPMYCVKGITK